MNSDRPNELFRRALRYKTGAQRAQFLAEACAGQPELREQVERLLRAGAQAQDDLDPTMTEAVSVAVEGPGQRIGRYKLLEKVGEGGWGVVYVAEQQEPVRRRVALKILKLGMDTQSVVARFEAERQALALMDHPNIAKVLDGGATERGRPYFVMELVRGIKLTDYCDQAHLGISERLRLFVPVCHAIQHAHQKGIIHRDIKPSNILVTLHDGMPVPKVIDFGIAKATEGRLTDKTVYTQLHQFIGTPAYMSPEQAEMSGLDIDTRSDIYSLGVVLYELLTGRPPFDSQELLQVSLQEMRRIIREREPERPSTRLRQTAAARVSVVPSPLVPRPSWLASDLDWVVMKCLEKERGRRYETANALAQDIDRHLRDEPVEARPPSTVYRLQKAIRRNRLAFAAAAAIVLALLLGVVVSTWQAYRATRAEAKAENARQEAVAAQAAADRAKVQETELRTAAQAQELAAWRRAYASDMNLAQQTLAMNNLGRARSLLNRHRPGPGQKDLRGWEWRYLWNQCRGHSQAELCQQSNAIVSLAVSPDGITLAIGEYIKGGLTLWNMRKRQETLRLSAGQGPVCAVFSPKEPLLACSAESPGSTSGLPYAVQVWDARSAKKVRELPLGGSCRGLAFSGDGTTLFASTTTPDCQITAWRIGDGTMLARFPATNASDVGTAFAVTTDGALAAHCGDSSEGIRVLDLTDGKQRWKARAAGEMVTALAFSPDGRVLASGPGYAEGAIQLWDVASGKRLGVCQGHEFYVSALLFDQAGKALVSASADHTIRLWDVSDPTQPRSLRVLRGHNAEVWQLAWLNNGTTLVSGAKDGVVRLWEDLTPDVDASASRLPGQFDGWRFTPDNQSVLTVDQAGRVVRWGLPGMERKEHLLEVRTDPTWRLSHFSRDARWLAVGSMTGLVDIWDLQRRSRRCQLQARETGVAPIAFLAHGQRLLLEHEGGAVSEWDLGSGREGRSWKTPRTYLGFGAVVSPDEHWCVALGDGPGLLKNLGSGRESTLPEIVDPRGCAFSLDGRRFAVPSAASGLVTLWETKNWQEVARLGGFMHGVHSAAFSSDGARLAVGSDAREAVRLWDLASGHDVITLEGSGSMFRFTAFSSDDTMLGSMSEFGALHFWHAPSWAAIEAAEAKQAE